MNRFARTVHLLRWELLRARLWLMALAAVCIAAALATATRQWDSGTSLLPILVFIVVLFVAATVMTGDPPLDPTAFGVGKPVDRVALIGAKLLVTIGICVGGVLMLQALLQASLGMNWASVRNDAIASGALLRSTLFMMMAVSVVSRSFRQVVVGTISIAAVITLGGQLVFWGFRAAVGVQLTVDPDAVRIFGLTSALLPLAFVGRMLYRPFTAAVARSLVVLLVVWQLASIATVALATQSIVSQSADRLHIAIDSVTASVNGEEYRAAFHMTGTHDSLATVLDYSQVYAVIAGSNRTDTLDFAGREDTDGDSRKHVSAQAVRSGALRFKRRGVIAPGGTLRFRVRGTQYHRQYAATVPLAPGTLLDRNGVRLTLRVDSLERNALHVTDVGGGFFSGAMLGAFSRFDFQPEMASGEIGETLDVMPLGNPDVAFVLLPGAARVRAEALLDGDMASLMAKGPRLRISEWKLDSMIVFEAVARVPASARFPRQE